MKKLRQSKKILWEILVPRYSNAGREYSIKYHQAWDKQVRSIAGGITILKTARGHWISPKGKVIVEEMIPIRIYCTEEAIEKIIGFTLEYYNQQAVFAYEVSSRVIIKYR